MRGMMGRIIVEYCVALPLVYNTASWHYDYERHLEIVSRNNVVLCNNNYIETLGYLKKIYTINQKTRKHNIFFYVFLPCL